MQPESAKLLSDILDAANRIVEYSRGVSLQDYLADSKVRDAIHWNFTIIGEALSQLHKFDSEVAEQITEWRRIISFRNQLIHGYGVIKSEITWDIIERKIPILLVEVQVLMDRQ